MLKMWKRDKARGDERRAPTREYSDQERALIAKMREYSWYHRIQVAPGIETEPIGGGYAELWEFLLSCLSPITFRGRGVLDIGCRDGFFSFEAEKRGASSIIGIDNDLSKGATDFLIPLFKSQVRMERLNLYDLDPARNGTFDIIMLFGVLYHLRYPVWGLRRIAACLPVGGDLLLETAIFKDNKHTAHLELLACPVENSPYEMTSCTFFNKRGLVTTVESLGFLLQSHRILDQVCLSKDGAFGVNRQFFHFTKQQVVPPLDGIHCYWDGSHAYHSVEAKNDPALNKSIQVKARSLAE